LAGVASAGTVGWAPDADLGTSELSREILRSSLFTALIAFLVGIVAVTAEWRHGTVTRTFLGTPRRGRVLVAKELAIMAVSAALAVFSLVVTLAVAIPWLVVEDSSLMLDGDNTRLIARIVVAIVLWGALGVGVGAAVQSQTPALVGSILWILLAEALIGALLGLVDVEVVADYLPGRALSALDGSVEDGLSVWVGGAVGLAWAVALGALGWLRMSRQDVT
jgi:hypothetical protein